MKKQTSYSHVQTVLYLNLKTFLSEKVFLLHYDTQSKQQWNCTCKQSINKQWKIIRNSIQNKNSRTEIE